MNASKEPRGEDASVAGDPRVGDVIAGKYQIQHVLGEGGMGVVVAAWHMALRKKVAVKFLLPQALKLEGASERFLREAQAAAALHSVHVARVIDIGKLETGAPYIVMEYLTGASLDHVIRTRGALPIEEAVGYVLQACEAIAEAHALGIIHRDLKPGNLFLTTSADGRPLVKVLDFGLSKVTRSDAPGAGVASLTASNVVVGSLQYMSPEQMRSLKHVDARTDVWALGVILYELLTGRRPFDGDTMAAVVATIIADTPPRPRVIRPEIPEALEVVLLQCLEKNVTRRIQSIAALVQAIEPFGPSLGRLSGARSGSSPELPTGAGGGRVSVADAPPRISAATTSSMSTWVQGVARPRRNFFAVLGVGGAAAALAVGAVTVSQSGSAEGSTIVTAEDSLGPAAMRGSAIVAVAQSAAAASPEAPSTARPAPAQPKKTDSMRWGKARQATSPQGGVQPTPSSNKPPADPYRW